jgi:hypothetical protein
MECVRRSSFQFTCVLIGIFAVLYGSALLEQARSDFVVTAKITQVDSKEYIGRLENLLHVKYEVDGEHYTKTLRTSDCVFFVDQTIELVYTNSPEEADFPNLTASLDAWCYIAFGVMLLLV